MTVSEKESGKIRKYYTKLCEQVNASSAVTKLHQHEVITTADREDIEKVITARGVKAAAGLLMDRMQCHLAPQEWYYHFLLVLQSDEECFDLLTVLEPDFILEPEKFQPCGNIRFFLRLFFSYSFFKTHTLFGILYP